MAALAGILEHWQNAIAPQIILLSSEEVEQAYFDCDMFPQGSIVHRAICSSKQQGEEVLAILNHIKEIDVVWSAFESG